MNSDEPLIRQKEIETNAEFKKELNYYLLLSDKKSANTILKELHNFS